MTRFIALGSLPGAHKPSDSKSTYIQAIELEPLTTMTKQALQQQVDTEATKDPFETSSPWQDPRTSTSKLAQNPNSRLTLGNLLLQREDAERRKFLIKQTEPREDSVYERDDNIVYISGFEAHCDPVKLEDFIKLKANCNLT